MSCSSFPRPPLVDPPTQKTLQLSLKKINYLPVLLLTCNAAHRPAGKYSISRCVISSHAASHIWSLKLSKEENIQESGIFELVDEKLGLECSFGRVVKQTDLYLRGCQRVVLQLHWMPVWLAQHRPLLGCFDTEGDMSRLRNAR